MTTILIARHGNTFDHGDVIVRVGLKSNLQLSNSGKQQAHAIGTYLAQQNIQLSAIFTSNLLRTITTAEIIKNCLNSKLLIKQDPMFNEIDYGPDEGKTEQQVIERLGQAAIIAWDTNALVPDGWLCEPDSIIKHWIDFAQSTLNKFPNQTILVVTSNGIARFAPYITGDFKQFSSKFKIKMATGAISSFTNLGEGWAVDYWDKRL